MPCARAGEDLDGEDLDGEAFDGETLDEALDGEPLAAPAGVCTYVCLYLCVVGR